MALSPTQLDRLPDNMVQLMSELQDEIISDICRRLTKANMLTPTAEWQLYKANQLTISSREVKRRIAAKLKVQERDLKDLYTESVKTAIAEDAKVYKIAIAEGILSDNYRDKLTNYTRSAAFSNVLKRGLKNTNGLMRNLTNSTAAMANRQLSDALDLCYLEVTSGAFTPQEAVFKAVQKLGADGIKVVNYASGHSDQIDVAVRRAVVTSIGKTCGDMQLDLANEMDCQLVEVSSHLGARPSHAEWQGRIYSLVKGHPKYPYFYDATGYGTGDGLCGWNCRHSFFPYFEGLSKPANEPNFSLAENEQVYKDTQKQRSYERAIRKSKRELAALDGARSASDDPALRAKLDREFERKSVTLKRREAALTDHLKATGLLPDNSRVRVDGFGRSISQKAVWAARKETTSSSKFSALLDEFNRGQKDTIKLRNIEKELNKSSIGQEILTYLENNPVKINLYYLVDVPNGLFGEYDSLGDVINIYASNTKTVRRTAETIIHEVTHRKYDIGGDFHSECVCRAQEYKHRYRKNNLTISELRGIIKEIKDTYAYNTDWRWR